MQNLEIARYKAGQQELYKIARMGWRNYSTRVADFTAARPLYTLAYGEECMAALMAAEALPTDNARAGLSIDNRILLTRAVDAGTQKWQMLKRYITSAYDTQRGEAMLKVAGQPHYTSANNYNWSAASALFSDGSKFITAHLAELTANNNMSPNFGDGFDAAKNAFESLQDQFFGSVTDGSTNTQIKIKANNWVFDKLNMMLLDAQQIYANDEGTKQQFVFSNLKAIVSGVGQAGLRGFITEAVTGISIAAATIGTTNNTYTATSDDAGRYDLTGLAANDYIVTITASGYVSQTMGVTVKTGTVSTQNVSLVIMEAAAEEHVAVVE